MSELSENLAMLARRFGLTEIYVFGSRASEVAARVFGQPASASHPDSDVDIGVRVRRGATLTAKERVLLSIAFEDLFDVGRVDLVILSEAPPFLALDIIAGELLHCEDSLGQAEYELYVLRRAGDLAPLERERRRLILGGEAR